MLLIATASAPRPSAGTSEAVSSSARPPHFVVEIAPGAVRSLVKTRPALLTIVSLAVSSVTHLDVSDLVCGPGRAALLAPVGGSLLDRSSLGACQALRSDVRDRANALPARGVHLLE